MATPAANYALFMNWGTASLSTHWLLVHLEQSYNVQFTIHPVDFRKGDQKTPEFLKLNPKGRVPILVIEGEPYSESAALAQILAERHPEANLAPPVGSPKRAKYIELMISIANNLLPALRDWFYAGKDGNNDPLSVAAIRVLASKRMEESWKAIDEELEGKSYLLGEEVSAVDFLAASFVGWTKTIEAEARRGGSNVDRWVDTMTSREDWIEVRRREAEIEKAQKE